MIWFIKETVINNYFTTISQEIWVLFLDVVGVRKSNFYQYLYTIMIWNEKYFPTWSQI